MLVEHDAHVALLLLHGAEYLGQLLHLRQIDCFLHYAAYCEIAALLVLLEELLLGNYTDDIVQGTLIHRHSGVFLLKELFPHIIDILAGFYRRDTHTGRDYLVHSYLVEFQGAAHKIALLGFKYALVLDLVDHDLQLFLSHADGFLPVEYL